MRALAFLPIAAGMLFRSLAYGETESWPVRPVNAEGMTELAALGESRSASAETHGGGSTVRARPLGLQLAAGDEGTASDTAGGPVRAGKDDSSRGYLGLSLGAANISIDQQGITSSHLVDFTYSVFGGNFLWKYLSIEYGFATLGDYSADYQITTGAFNASEHHEIKFDRSAFICLVGWLPETALQNLWNGLKLPADLRVYGKLGASYWHAKLQMSGQLFESGTFLNSYGSQGEGSGISPLYGVGLHYRLGANTAVRLDWTIYSRVGQGTKLQLSDGTQNTFDGRSVSVVGLGIVYSY